MPRLPIVALCLALTASPAAADDDPPSEERVHSMSVGTPSRGELRNGKPVRLRGRYHRVIAVTVQRGFYYGTEELVALIGRGARRVARKHPGSVLQVANLSRRGGRRIPQSVTHNSGRDADLLFYVTDAEGEPAVNQQFVRFDRQGRAGDLRFDVARNWTLVRAFVTDRRAQVQSMLVARWLKAPLMAHARTLGEPAWILERADAVLRQPRRSPHDDHFHVRVMCARHERLSGCINRGPVHKALDTFDDEVAALALQLAEDFGHAEAPRAVAALRRVGLIRAETVTDAVVAALADPRVRVRRAALHTLELLGAVQPATSQIVAAATKARPGGWQTRLVRLMADRSIAEGREVFLRVLADREHAAEAARSAAAEGLGKTLDTTAVPTLAHALTDPAEAVQEAADAALERITYRTYGRGEPALESWRAWWEQNGEAGRAAWLRQAFAERHGIEVTRRGCARVVRKLVRLLRRARDSTMSFNTRALIADMTGFETSRTRRVYRTYRRWLRRGGARKCTERMAAAE